MLLLRLSLRLRCCNRAHDEAYFRIIGIVHAIANRCSSIAVDRHAPSVDKAGRLTISPLAAVLRLSTSLSRNRTTAKDKEPAGQVCQAKILVYEPGNAVR
jgi:hypothetical protein